ncbi:Signal transduction histidine kinase-like protein [Desulfofarcimen acetoxidans DSM 771]|uniref:histidine kinase n=1 Tax=Desulfofarcimen acetoxidans (strain ATCC 49208 / DSM 771 / KCTC 5769 / VKM B-1644 / 5575) TaxID=485916 RepID=C8VX67_DESAS|nr:histidine kinase [Desulfofarcimen acetoxidans]ACV64463.1 Signal transduction histidine kinase-like protein [Desulfofarcimen acetoxidans DSM 771]
MAITLYFDKTSDRLIAGILYIILMALMTYHHLCYNKPEGLLPGGKKLMVAELACALCVLYFEHSVFPGISIVLIISYAILVYEARFSVPYTLIALFAYIGILYYKADAPVLYDFWLENRVILLPRIIIILVIINTRNVINSDQKNRKLSASLAKKNRELEAAMDQMAVYMDELKKTADLRARERLMHELHNKLGHILATASIGAQATAVLMDKNISHAKMQLESVAQQIRAAMQSLRSVIIGEASYPSDIGWDYTDRILSLISETERLTGITIVHNLSEAPAKELDELAVPKQSFLYNTLMEGLTNGLRHGKATGFEFELRKTGGRILFRLQDNGTGFHNIRYGYGLTKIQKDAVRFGAELKIRGYAGCVIEIVISDEDESMGRMAKCQK